MQSWKMQDLKGVHSMSLIDSLRPPPNSPAPAEEKAIIERIEERLQKINKLLKENRISKDHLNMLIHFLRSQITKIYGQNSDIRNFFIPLREKVAPDDAAKIAANLSAQAETFIDYLNNAGRLSFAPRKVGKIFIGHGRSLLWRELKDFLSDRLSLGWDEFNREAVAGLMTFDRLAQMLSEAAFAFLIMTAEDEHIDHALHARENVVHEVGLFQGRLGPKRAIILLEDGCKQFSNIIGLSQIHFPKGHISATFEEIRRVLEREAII
jgi:predicted nucleotide-binding protein